MGWSGKLLSKVLAGADFDNILTCMGSPWGGNEENFQGERKYGGRVKGVFHFARGIACVCVCARVRVGVGVGVCERARIREASSPLAEQERERETLKCMQRERETGRDREQLPCGLHGENASACLEHPARFRAAIFLQILGIARLWSVRKLGRMQSMRLLPPKREWEEKTGQREYERRRSTVICFGVLVRASVRAAASLRKWGDFRCAMAAMSSTDPRYGALR